MGSSSADYSLLESGNTNAAESLGDYDRNSITLAKKLLSEFIGSLVLVLGGAGAAVMNEQSNEGLGIHGRAGGGALAVGLVTLATGHISGAHINPAVTLAFATFRHFPWIQVPLYIVAQLLASITGAFLVEALYGSGSGLGATVPAGSDAQSLLFELVLTAVLMFVITSVSTDTRAVGELAGIAVAIAVYLGILLGGYISGASMNPVRTLGPAIASGTYKGLWIYFVGPIIGAQIGAGLYTLIRFRDQEQRRNVFQKK